MNDELLPVDDSTIYSHLQLLDDRYVYCDVVLFYLDFIQARHIRYYIGGSLYVGLRLIFQDGDQIYNLQMIITLSSCLLRPYKLLG